MTTPFETETESVPSEVQETSRSTRRHWLRRPVFHLAVVASFGGIFFAILWLGPFPPANGRISTQLCQLAAGLDVSIVQAAEDHGAVFRRLNGNVTPGLDIPTEFGYQWMRLRVMVEPDQKYGLFQNLPYVLKSARAIKSRGFQLLLDFHYSHWWADPENQWTPLVWRNATHPCRLQCLQDKVYNHTKYVLQALKEQDTAPDAVQIGNEITSGMLWESGRITDEHWETGPNGQHWGNIVSLINRGVEAVNQVFSDNQARPKIVIHLDQGGNTERCEAWLKHYLDAGGTLDVLGLSYYPMWHGSLDDLKANIDNLHQKFPQLDVWVVETAYHYKGDGCADTDEDCQKKFPFPQTEQGQFDYLVALQQTLSQTHCQAVFYWGAYWSQPQKWFHTDSSEQWEETERRALFDEYGRALKGMAALAQDCESYEQ